MDISKLKNPGGRNVNETPRLIIMAVLFVIILAIFLFFNYKEKMQKEERFDAEKYLDAPDSVRIPASKVSPELLKSVKDTQIADRVIKENEPYLHLIMEAAKLVYGDMELLGVKNANAEAILKDSAAHRGVPYEIKGNLQWFEEVTDLNFKLYRGYLTSLNGDNYYFTVLNFSDDIKVGDVVKLQGFFYKIYSFNLQGEDKRINDAIFLVGKHLIPSFYEMPPVNQLNPRLLDALYDFELEDQIKPLEEKQLYHMLSFVNNIDDETYEKLKADGIFEEHLAKAIKGKPNLYRGAPVRIVGEVIWFSEKLLGPEGENPIGKKRVYHGINRNNRGGSCYFITFQDPSTIKLQGLYYHDGFFFRNYAYKTRDEQLRSSPVIIVRGYEPFKIPEDTTFIYISLIILGGALVAFVFFLIHTLLDRKENRKYREKFIQRKKRELQRILDSEGKIIMDTPTEDGALDSK